MQKILVSAGKKRAKGRQDDSCKIIPLFSRDLETQLAKLDPVQAAWAKRLDFKARSGEHILLPDRTGDLDVVLFGLGANDGQLFDDFLPGELCTKLPAGTYRFEPGLPNPRLAYLSWLLQAYQFERYKEMKPARASVVVADKKLRGDLQQIGRGVFLARDLINTPAEDLGPAELEAAVRRLGRTHKAKVAVTTGDALLRQNFPLIHIVGRASNRAPRLIDLRWGDTKAPKVTLVGKGVCFDTGGLNLKPGRSMALMKKDMGGAANVLGLACMLMEAKVPIRLRVLIPAVDNNVSGNAYRPGDVLPSRSGMTVEIGNTDAEGRLVLADALTLADEEKPDVLIDMATLTGAARVALGPELPPFYTDDGDFATALVHHADEQSDPLWRMPLWRNYDNWLDSQIADVNHISDSGFAGSITAALFLKRFVSNAKCYAHFDIFAWNPKSRPGRPKGGEAQAIRALFMLLTEKYAR